jgi:hypothetical protein
MRELLLDTGSRQIPAHRFFNREYQIPRTLVFDRLFYYFDLSALRALLFRFSTGLTQVNYSTNQRERQCT